MIAEKHIAKYQQLYLHYFGKEIGRDSACEQLDNLVNLLRIIYRPIKKEDYERFKASTKDANL